MKYRTKITTIDGKIVERMVCLRCGIHTTQSLFLCYDCAELIACRDMVTAMIVDGSAALAKDELAKYGLRPAINRISSELSIGVSFFGTVPLTDGICDLLSWIMKKYGFEYDGISTSNSIIYKLTGKRRTYTSEEME